MTELIGRVMRCCDWCRVSLPDHNIRLRKEAGSKLNISYITTVMSFAAFEDAEIMNCIQMQTIFCSKQRSRPRRGYKMYFGPTQGIVLTCEFTLTRFSQVIEKSWGLSYFQRTVRRDKARVCWQTPMLPTVCPCMSLQFAEFGQ